MCVRERVCVCEREREYVCVLFVVFGEGSFLFFFFFFSVFIFCQKENVKHSHGVAVCAITTVRDTFLLMLTGTSDLIGRGVSV